MKSRLQGSDIEIYSTNDEGMCNVSERFIIIWKNKIHKCITSTSKNTYIDKLYDMVDKYKNSYQRTIRMKPANFN